MASDIPLSQSTFLVSLFDDLTGKLEIGDSVSIIGHASMVATISCNKSVNLPPSGYGFAEVKIIANNIFTPFDLNSVKVFPAPSLQKGSIFSTKDGLNVSLDKLCKAICHGRNTYEVWPKLLPVALLLSLVSSNVNVNSIKSDQNQNMPECFNHFNLLSASGQKIAASPYSSIRKQIHILISTEGFPSAMSMSSFQVAGLYASRSVYGSEGMYNNKLKSKLKQEDSSGDTQTLYAGQLDLAKGGVLILDLSVLSKSKIRTLSDAVRETGKSRFDNWQITGANEYRSGATIWATLGRNHQHTNKSSANSTNMLVKGFDIVLQESLDLYSNDRELLQDLVSRLDSSKMKNEYPSAHGFSADLRHHLVEATRIGSVSITDSARKLIQLYHLALRRDQEYVIDCVEDKCEYSSLVTLHSLLRVAEACARLCLKNEIREVC